MSTREPTRRRTRTRRSRVLAGLGVLLVLSSARAHDWPQLHGPRRDGSYRSSDVIETWPSSPPTVLWSRSVGEGFSGPVVAGKRVIVFHRRRDEERVECFAVDSGDVQWTYGYPTKYRDTMGFNGGPRATPAISGGRVYTFGAQGILSCVDLEKGAKVWQVKTQEKFQVRKEYFGVGCSPLVHDGKVLLIVGGRKGGGIVAFDAGDGHVVWKSTSDDASYSSPVVAEIGGEPHAFFFTRRGLVDLEPGSGRLRWDVYWRARINESVNAVTPLVVGDLVFISASYSTGALLVRAGKDRYEKVWARDGVLSNHYATCVHHDGYLYGFHGRQEAGADLRCVELKTAEVRWSHEGFRAGTLIRAGSRLLILDESGKLTLARASPRRFESLGSVSILETTTRPYPALADGLFFARDEEKIVCVDLRKKR